MSVDRKGVLPFKIVLPCWTFYVFLGHADPLKELISNMIFQSCWLRLQPSALTKRSGWPFQLLRRLAFCYYFCQKCLDIDFRRGTLLRARLLDAFLPYLRHLPSPCCLLFVGLVVVGSRFGCVVEIGLWTSSCLVLFVLKWVEFELTELKLAGNQQPLSFSAFSGDQGVLGENTYNPYIEKEQ